MDVGTQIMITSQVLASEAKSAAASDLATQVGTSCGAPMLIANAARTLFEIGVQQIGATANVDEIARLFEAMAGIRFGGD